jgi:hypothetical protein
MQKEAEDPIAFAASWGDPETLSYKDAMGAIDSLEFKTAIVKEANDHADRGTWRFGRRETYLRVTRSSLLSGLSSASGG